MSQHIVEPKKEANGQHTESISVIMYTLGETAVLAWVVRQPYARIYKTKYNLDWPLIGRLGIKHVRLDRRT